MGESDHPLHPHRHRGLRRAGRDGSTPATRSRSSTRRPTATRRCSSTRSCSGSTVSPNHHLAFGSGPHFCMGANLARVELEALFRHLLDPPRRLRTGRPAGAPELGGQRRHQAPPLRCRLARPESRADETQGDPSVGTMKFGIAFANIGPFVEPGTGPAIWPGRPSRPASSRSGRSTTWWCRPATDRPTPTTRRGACRRARTRRFPIRSSGWPTWPGDVDHPAGHRHPDPPRSAIRWSWPRNWPPSTTCPPGRVTLGVGIGWLKEEFEALGIPFEGRAERTEEAIAAMRALWSQDRASMEGSTR